MTPFKYLFEKSLKNLIFLIFKGGDLSNVSNYRFISIVPWFSNILESIVHNLLYRNLNTKELLYLKQFRFSTKHSTVKLADEIHKSFEKDHFTLGAFLDLPKAFDTVKKSKFKVSKH